MQEDARRRAAGRPPDTADPSAGPEAGSAQGVDATAGRTGQPRWAPSEDRPPAARRRFSQAAWLVLGVSALVTVLAIGYAFWLGARRDVPAPRSPQGQPSRYELGAPGEKPVPDEAPAAVPRPSAGNGRGG